MLKQMARRRRGHGIVAWQEEVYVFGGSDRKPLSFCEKYSDMDWHDLPNMRTARRYFNPALHYPRIYIVGGDPCRASEVFLIPEARFQPLPLQLIEAAETCAFVADDQLVVIARTSVLRWSLKRLEGSGESQGHATLHPWSNLQPVVWQDQVFLLLMNCGQCIPGSALKVWSISHSSCSSLFPA